MRRAKTEAARLSAALLDQFGTSVKPGKLEVLDIDDTFCATHGGQQLRFWNAHHDERGFASMHIFTLRAAKPVATILRRHAPQGHEVRTRHQACDQAPAPPLAENPHRVARRQPLRPGRGDEWAEDHDADYIFGLAGNAVLDALVAETATTLRFHHALSSKREAAHLCEFHVPGRQLENGARKVVARLECSIAAGRGGRDRHAPGGRHPLHRHFAQGLGATSFL